MIAVANVHLLRRLARHHADPEPRELTSEEKKALAIRTERNLDDLLRFENRDRYIAQSRATRDGHPAPIPPRKELRK